MTTEDKAKSKARDRQKSSRGPARPRKALPETPAEPQWREQAAFHVTLDHTSDVAGLTSWQTHAYHEETGDERVLPGVLGQALIGWMRERAGLPSEAHAAPAAESAPVALAAELAPAEMDAPTALSVGALEVLEIPAEAQAGGQVLGGRLCAKMAFDLNGSMAHIAAALRPYTIQVIAVDLLSAAALPLASLRRDLQPDLLRYAETLDLDVPPVGSYQLIANVVLSDDAVAVALGPVLHVVP